MDRMLLRIFQGCVEEQCAEILRAYEAIAAEPWPAFQRLLVATANVSKLLWGQGGEHATARAPLRASLGVDDSSPLRSRDMRNHFEHVDERLDMWWAESPNHVFVDANIGPYPMTVGVKEIELFRQYDPATGKLWFWGESFNVNEIVAEVRRIYPTVKSEAAKPHWD